jgi:hypothetical protein
MLTDLTKIDVTVPAVVLDTGPDAAGGLAAIRVLGRLGIAVFGVHDSPWAPAAQSRYLSGRLVVPPGPHHGERARAGLIWLAERIGRRAALLPAGQVAASYLAEYHISLRDSFLLRRPGERFRMPGGDQAGPGPAIAAYLALTGQLASLPGPAAGPGPAGWFAGDDMLPYGLRRVRGVTRALSRSRGRRGSGRAPGEAGLRPGLAAGPAAGYRPGRGLPGMFPGTVGRPALAGGRARHD